MIRRKFFLVAVVTASVASLAAIGLKQSQVNAEHKKAVERTQDLNTVSACLPAAISETINHAGERTYHRCIGGWNFQSSHRQDLEGELIGSGKGISTVLSIDMQALTEAISKQKTNHP